MTQEIDAATRAAIEKAAQRRIQAIVEEAGNPNHFGAWTLFKREFLRFWRMSRQTILSPVITTLLYFLVFGYSLGGRLRDIDGVPYIDFLVPGLVMLGVISNAFMNSSFVSVINCARILHCPWGPWADSSSSVCFPVPESVQIATTS